MVVIKIHNTNDLLYFLCINCFSIDTVCFLVCFFVILFSPSTIPVLNILPVVLYRYIYIKLSITLVISNNFQMYIHKAEASIPNWFPSSSSPAIPPPSWPSSATPLWTAASSSYSVTSCAALSVIFTASLTRASRDRRRFL